MLIKSLKINGFGKLKSKELKFKPGLNVIFGPNASGKTTIAYFILNALSKPGDELKKYEPWDHYEFGGEITTDEGTFKVDFLNGEFNTLVDRDLFETVGFIKEDEKLDTLKEKDSFVIGYMKKKMQKNEWGLRLTEAIEKTNSYVEEVQSCIEDLNKEIVNLDKEIVNLKQKLDKYNEFIIKQKRLKKEKEEIESKIWEKKEKLEDLRISYTKDLNEKIKELNLKKEELSLKLQDFVRISKIDREKVTNAKELIETMEIIDRNLNGILSHYNELLENLETLEKQLKEKMKGLNIENEKELETVNLKIKNLSLLKKMYDEKKHKLEDILEENPLWKLFSEKENLLEEVEEEEEKHKESQQKLQTRIDELKEKLNHIFSSAKIHKDFSFVFFFASVISLLLGFLMTNVNMWLFTAAIVTGFIGLIETVIWRKKEGVSETIRNEIDELTKKKIIRPRYLSILREHNLKSLKELRQKYYEFIEWKAKKKDYQSTSEEFKKLESEILKELKDFNLGSAAQIIDSGISYLEKLVNEIQKLIISKSSLEKQTIETKNEIENLKRKKEELTISLNKLLEELKLSLEEIKNFDTLYDEYLKITEEISKLDTKIEKYENMLNSEILPENMKNLEFDLEKLKKRLSDIDTLLLEKFENIPSFEEILEKIKKKEELIGKIDALKAYSSKISTAKEILKKKLEEYVETYGKKFKEEFTKILHSIVNEPMPIIVEDNLSVRLNINGEKLNPEEFLSAATFDQMLFAYKVALFNTMSEHNLPLIIDNAFIRYDDERLNRVLKILQNEAKRRQIILLTSDLRLADKFKEVVELEG
ncbi:hypothetical protein SU69_02475 [Thermosipho melanesiensis]|uniref:YhaN AAA domain-containing protein n=2 Tax=Thermosipho melanesiensis TaxID=46541 RepID=A6LK97_THEM4|nr:AAA family ATPase [Thermosipho melanesiensis]ABR30348.1 conserved hypothetical protein [Thermosipho melanesiensis BI429]APT73514.1 hypothetical protein BW47_02585 [Thermosipho melanesiensis]OOC37464.1 hypothetical protein SU68_02490 [Thermosipho melanesiensis]OOC39669.1 hypothetical protein SU69_02475 [Thermosipho melanesiensis]OOC39697.1 hypothetical protein SU70_02470 [Thermosipho melanesiensis]